MNNFKYLFIFLFFLVHASVKSSHDPDSQKSTPLHRAGSLQTWKSARFGGVPAVIIDLDARVKLREGRKTGNELKDSFGRAGSNDDDEDAQNEVQMEQARVLAAGALFMTVVPTPAVMGGAMGSKEEDVVQGSDPALVETFLTPMRRRSVSEVSPLRKSGPLPFDEFLGEKSAPATLRIKEDPPQRRPSTPKAVVSETQPVPQKKPTSPKTPKSKPKLQIGGSVTPNTMEQMDLMNAEGWMRAQKNLVGSVFNGRNAPKKSVKKGWKALFSKRTDDSDDDS